MLAAEEFKNYFTQLQNILTGADSDIQQMGFMHVSPGCIFVSCYMYNNGNIMSSFCYCQFNTQQNVLASAKVKVIDDSTSKDCLILICFGTI